MGEGIQSAREIYASEEEKGSAVVENGKLVTSFKPYEIKSFALKLKPSSIDSLKTESVPVLLNYDKNIITKKAKKVILNIQFQAPLCLMKLWQTVLCLN